MNLAPGKELSDEQDKPNGFQKPETTFDIGPYKNCIYHKSGLFSTIYKGRSPGYTFLCAIKETSLSTEEPPHNSEREARLLRKAAHPNVVELLEVTRLSNGHLLLSFPFLPFTLEDLLDFQSPLMTKDLMGQLFRGLAHLHCEKSPLFISFSPFRSIHFALHQEYLLARRVRASSPPTLRKSHVKENDNPEFRYCSKQTRYPPPRPKTLQHPSNQKKKTTD